MPQYDNEMRGVLFKNDKRTNDKAPQMKGECQIGGVRYWVSAWTQTKRDSDERYQQLRFERAEDRHQPAGVPSASAAPPPTATTPAEQPPGTAEDFGMAPGADPDDIPF